MPKNRYQISTRQILNGLSKLHLEPGDVVVVNHPAAAEALMNLGSVVPFRVPIVVCPDGIKKLSRQDLLNLLEQIEEPIGSIAPIGEMVAPA